MRTRLIQAGVLAVVAAGVFFGGAALMDQTLSRHEDVAPDSELVVELTDRDTVRCRGGQRGDRRGPRRRVSARGALERASRQPRDARPRPLPVRDAPRHSTTPTGASSSAACRTSGSTTSWPTSCRPTSAEVAGSAGSARISSRRCRNRGSSIVRYATDAPDDGARTERNHHAQVCSTDLRSRRGQRVQPRTTGSGSWPSTTTSAPTAGGRRDRRGGSAAVGEDGDDGRTSPAAPRAATSSPRTARSPRPRRCSAGSTCSTARTSTRRCTGRRRSPGPGTAGSRCARSSTSAKRVDVRTSCGVGEAGLRGRGTPRIVTRARRGARRDPADRGWPGAGHPHPPARRHRPSRGRAPGRDASRPSTRGPGTAFPTSRARG